MSARFGVPQLRPHNYGTADLAPIRAGVSSPEVVESIGFDRYLIRFTAGILGIQTTIDDSRRYRLHYRKSLRVLELVMKAGGSVYLSGPRGRAYLDESAFQRHGIAIEWVNYDGYPEYPQLHGSFRHDVSILDLLFMVGDDAPLYMKSFDTTGLQSQGYWFHRCGQQDAVATRSCFAVDHE